MPVRVINVSEARRDLPRLVRQVARSGAVVIGPRGRATAVLVGADEYEALRSRAGARASTSGWQRLRLDLDGTLDDLDADLRMLRQEAPVAAVQTPRRRRSTGARRKRSP